MDSPPAPPIRTFLAQRVRDGASAGQVAEIVHSAWERIAAALAPVIGHRGVAALYRRSLYLAAVSHAWLAVAQGGGSLAEMDLAPLRVELARHSGTEAAAAGATILLSFHGLVGSLIGPALSGQLLGGVWGDLFSGSPAQDPPS